MRDSPRKEPRDVDLQFIISDPSKEDVESAALVSSEAVM